MSKSIKPQDPAAFKRATAKLLESSLQAITVHFVGATSTRPSRVVARAAGGARLEVGFDHAGEVGGDEDRRAPYAAAALALQAELGWNATHDLVMGGMVGGAYVFVQVPKTPASTDPPRYTVDGNDICDRGKPILHIERWEDHNRRFHISPHDVDRMRPHIVELLNERPLPDRPPPRRLSRLARLTRKGR